MQRRGIYRGELIETKHSLGATACQLISWMGGDNRFGRLNLWGWAAWPSGLAAMLHVLDVACAAFESHARAGS